MIGHDLMAWPPAPPTRLGSQRWCGKVLTEREREWLAPRPALRLNAAQAWILKEAAYKLARKRGYPRIFRPQDFELSPTQGPSFQVQSYLGTWPGLVKIHPPGYLLALVAETEGELAQTILRQRQLNVAERARRSAAVRQLLGEVLAEKWPGQVAAWELKQDGAGIPTIWYRQKRWPVEVSLSHDGDWISVAVAMA